MTWSNWAGNQRCAPASVERPTSDAELSAVVKRAAADGRRVKPVGAGHSFTDIAVTDGVQVRLDGYDRVLGLDREAKRITVQSGISIAALNERLAAAGLAMPNMGDIAYQSIAGATATATHGTGVRFGNLSSRIVGMRLIDGTGEIVECSATQRPELFDVARVGIGAIGVVSALTLQCVPAFRLHAVEEPMPVDDVLRDFDGFFSSTDHVELYWIPGTRWALTKRNTRTDDAPSPRPRVRALIDDAR